MERKDLQRLRKYEKYLEKKLKDFDDQREQKRIQCISCVSNNQTMNGMNPYDVLSLFDKELNEKKKPYKEVQERFYELFPELKE